MFIAQQDGHAGRRLCGGMGDYGQGTPPPRRGNQLDQRTPTRTGHRRDLHLLCLHLLPHRLQHCAAPEDGLRLGHHDTSYRPICRAIVRQTTVSRTLLCLAEGTTLNEHQVNYYCISQLLYPLMPSTLVSLHAISYPERRAYLFLIFPWTTHGLRWPPTRQVAVAAVSRVHLFIGTLGGTNFRDTMNQRPLRTPSPHL